MITLDEHYGCSKVITVVPLQESFTKGELSCKGTKPIK